MQGPRDHSSTDQGSTDEGSTDQGSSPAERAMRREMVSRLQALTADSRTVATNFSSEHGLSSNDFDALLFVMQQEQSGTPATPGRIADNLGLTSGAATGVIDRLAKRGHVERRRDAEDRRIVRVHFAKAAREVASEFFAPLGVLTDDVMSHYSADELALVSRFLGEMSAAMRTHAGRDA